MQIQGRRIYIAGSAGSSIDPKLLKYAHDLIKHLVRSLAKRGATFSIGVGKDPRSLHGTDSLPIIFDWTVISALNDCLNQGVVQPSNQHGKLVTTVATSKTDGQIPEDRRMIWERLLKDSAVFLEHIEPGWHSGAVRRNRLMAQSDALIILGGGEGVEHLANRYIEERKPVIALDLPLGSSSNDGNGGAANLARKTLAQPKRFLRLANSQAVGTILAQMATKDGTTPIQQVVDAIIALIDLIIPPTAFYTRLLNPNYPEFNAVENFFRNVVDPLVEQAGYQPVELGRTRPERAWINEEVFEQLHYCGLVIADLTALRPNCLVELGYALGRERRLLLTAQKGTTLPFDINSLDCHFWVDTRDYDQHKCELSKYWERNALRSALVRS